MGDIRLRIAAGGRAAGALWAGRRWLAGIAAITVGTLMVGGLPTAPALAARAGPVWTVVPSANPRAPLGELTAVSCAGPAACTAVGYSGREPLAETWNGHRWAIHPLPSAADRSQLLDVSCSVPTACVAIGAKEGSALALRWDGRRWHTMALPRLAGAALAGVSCRSARFCVATGSYSHGDSDAALAEVWNGVRWSARSVPLPAGAQFSELTAVSCARLIACTAVGDYTRRLHALVLAETWNGVRWARSPILTPPGDIQIIGMTGVSCPAVNACQAVGNISGSAGNSPLAESWNGTRWAAETTPSAATLNGVSCASPSACLAAGTVTGPTGHDIVFAQAWNGTAWTVLHTPVSKTAAQFDGVSCSAAATCTAVGDYITGRGQPVLALRWNGTGWGSQPAPTPVAVFGGDLAGISCTSATWCAAVGDVANAAQVYQPLAEVWDGHTWSVVPTPHLAAETDTQLSRVACASPQSCIAVGTSGAVNALAEFWNGHTWALTKVASPAPAQRPLLAGVTCLAAGSCLAVGVSGSATLAERWNGTAWTVQPTPNPPGSQYSALTAVTCTSATACTAVGFQSNSGTGITPLAERWDGTAWTVQPTPSPGLDPQFTAVSCPSATACTAIGTTQDGGFAENWDGTAWTAVTVPSLSSGQATLTGVACTAASACEAVGGVVDDSGHNDAMLAEHWNGTTWRIESTQLPPGAGGPVLSDVSCLRGAGCLAVGTRVTDLFNGGTLVEHRD